MDRPERPPGNGRSSLADLIDSVRWDYAPAERLLSPLTATARYFEAFPWEGEEDDEEASPAGRKGDPS